MKNHPEKPAIDIIVTAHNMEDVIDETIASLAAQTMADFQALIVEDGSTDSTASKIQAWVDKDPRFSVVSTPGLGAGQARNTGMTSVTAPYFMILDGDDIFHPTMLEHLLLAANSTNADIVICNCTQFNHQTRQELKAPWAFKQCELPRPLEGSVYSWREIPGNIFAAFMGWPWDKLYRTSFIHEHSLQFPTNLSNSEDGVFTYLALVLANRLTAVDEILIEHRIERGSSISQSRVQDPFAFYEAILQLRKALESHLDREWDKLKKDFLNWAFDWTLWNIETMNDLPTQNLMVERLFNNEFKALELTEHEPSYFTGYPRSMARYTSLVETLANPNAGPLGDLDQLPYGKYKPWSRASLPQKLVYYWNEKRNKPVTW